MRLGRVQVRGDAFCVGHELGEAARASIHEVLPRIERYRALRREWAGSPRIAALEAAARASFPGYVREIEGMAAGAEVDFADLFLWNCRGDLPGGGEQSAEVDAECTTLLVPGRGGEPGVIAHNEDDQPELDGHCFLADVVPEDGIAFTSFCSPGLLPGHTFGVNERGLVQTINHVRPRDQRDGVPRHVVCRAVLGTATLEEALAVLARDDRASGFHHNLGQAGDPRLLSVEAPASGCEVRRIDSPTAHANHLLRPAFSRVAQIVTASSEARQRRAEALIADGTLAHAGPLAVLADTHDAQWPIRRRRRDGADTGYTLATAVFRVGTEGVDWHAFGDDPGRPEHSGAVRPAAAPA